jgi:hypothetical protein
MHAKCKQPATIREGHERPINTSDSQPATTVFESAFSSEIQYSCLCQNKRPVSKSTRRAGKSKAEQQGSQLHIFRKKTFGGYKYKAGREEKTAETN